MTDKSPLGRKVVVSVVGTAAALAFWHTGGVSDAVPALRLKDATAAPAPKRAAAKPAPLADADRFIGDAALQDKLDLSRARLVGERYYVKLDTGETAVLTLDPEVQAAAEATLARAQAPYGAIVVTATDGRILAFAGRSNADGREKNFDLPAQVWAPAASIFKVVTAAALVDAGVSPDKQVCVHGGVRSVEPSNLKDDPRRDTLCADLGYGVARSQNAIIAKLVHRHLKPRRLREFAHRLGFDGAPHFAVPAEPPQVTIPAEPLSFARTAAGFWNTEISPLSGALLANTIGSGGMRVTPRIVAAVVDEAGVERSVVGVEPARVMSKKTARRVAEMMVETTETGTARKAFRDPRGVKFLRDVRVAGKTGSLSRTEPSYLGYSWFVGFAPADQPEVAISVLLANEPRWHLKAHTAARLVLQSAL